MTIVTACATAVTSWSEFADVSHKVERYSSAITQLQMLLTWWDSLTEVKKASKENINNLVRTSETFTFPLTIIIIILIII